MCSINTIGDSKTAASSATTIHDSNIHLLICFQDRLHLMKLKRFHRQKLTQGHYLSLIVFRIRESQSYSRYFLNLIQILSNNILKNLNKSSLLIILIKFKRQKYQLKSCIQNKFLWRKPVHCPVLSKIWSINLKMNRDWAHRVYIIE